MLLKSDKYLYELVWETKKYLWLTKKHYCFMHIQIILKLIKKYYY